MWTPRSGNRFVLTGLTIASNAAGTFTFYIGTTTSGPEKVAQFTLAASATIAPVFGPIESTAKGYILYGRPASSGTDGFNILATGWEDPI